MKIKNALLIGLGICLPPVAFIGACILKKKIDEEDLSYKEQLETSKYRHYDCYGCDPSLFDYKISCK